MSKTFKHCTIFFVTTMFLVIMRIIFSVIKVSSNVGDWLFSFLVQVIGMGVVPLLMYKFWVKDGIVEGFYVKPKLNFMVYFIAIVLGFLVHLLIVNVSVVWQNIMIITGFTPANSVTTIYSGPEVLVMDLLCTALLPAMFEELTYRGLGMRMLSKVKDERVTLILLATLFGLGHQFILQTGYAFGAGLVLAYVAMKTRSIIPGVIIHFMNNALSVISAYSDQVNGLYSLIENKIYDLLFSNWITLIISTAVVISAIVALLKMLNRFVPKKEEIKVEDEGAYFYPNSAQYIDELFGKPMWTANYRGEVKKRTAWYEYAFLYGSIAITLVTTFFTYVWGIMR